MQKGRRTSTTCVILDNSAVKPLSGKAGLGVRLNVTARD